MSAEPFLQMMPTNKSCEIRLAIGLYMKEVRNDDKILMVQNEMKL